MFISGENKERKKIKKKKAFLYMMVKNHKMRERKKHGIKFKKILSLQKTHIVEYVLALHKKVRKREIFIINKSNFFTFDQTIYLFEITNYNYKIKLTKKKI